MSREAYSPPSLPASGSIMDGSLGGIGGIGGGGAGGASTQYLCGDCNAKVQLKKGDPIRCKECGHRVLYKERTKR